jgi:hypothetical protein
MSGTLFEALIKEHLTDIAFLLQAINTHRSHV